MIRYLLAASVFSLALPAVAHAQNKPIAIEVEAGEPFLHKHTGLGFPTAIDGLTRDRVSDGAPEQYDVSVNYSVAGDDAALTFYIYRQMSGALPIWFDRAQWAIETRDIYGRATSALLPPSFAPPGQATKSALSASYGLDDSAFRSTAVAIVPLDDWLVKARMSSRSLDPRSLDVRLKAALAALDWPSDVTPAPAAVPVEACADRLAFTGVSQDVLDKDAALMGALMSGILAQASTDPDRGDDPAPPMAWCRDATAVDVGAVYRANGEDDGYLLALSDAGRGVRVAPSASNAVLAAGEDGEGTPPSWSVDFIDLTRTIAFRPQDRLPTPERVIAILGAEPISVAETTGKERAVQIDSSTFE